MLVRAAFARQAVHEQVRGERAEQAAGQAAAMAASVTTQHRIRLIYHSVCRHPVLARDQLSLKHFLCYSASDEKVTHVLVLVHCENQVLTHSKTITNCKCDTVCQQSLHFSRSNCLDAVLSLGWNLMRGRAGRLASARQRRTTLSAGSSSS